ncbi:MAG: sigma 54-interacting transcriptional regulator [Polyangiaceae bacterium]
MTALDARFTLTDFRPRSVKVPDLRIAVSLPDGSAVEAPLGLDPVTVGTAEDCDLVLADPRVSRRHCRLTLVERGVLLEDLDSKNGTLLGDTNVLRALVAPETPVLLGGSRLVVRIAGEPSVLDLHPVAHFGGAIGSSLAMRALFARLQRASASQETILLLGESGTGKEVLARAVHDTSPRRDGPFVVLDCSAVAPNLVEDELFGHAKGAFTGAQAARPGVFEQASAGTLFIDEIGELPLELQPKLLRALETRQARRIGALAKEAFDFDCRIVAATHRDLRALVAEGKFRSDLYYRLQVLEMRVPPLREHKEDIPLLVERLLAASTPPRRVEELPANTMAMLTAHDWPGNVRELRNAVARLVVLADLGDLKEAPSTPNAPSGEADLGALLAMPLRDARSAVIERFEYNYLRATLRRNGGNVIRAAEAMGVTRQLVYKMMARYGID